MFALRQVVVLGVGVVGFGLGIGAGLMLSKRTAAPAAEPSVEAPPLAPPFAPSVAGVTPAPPVVGITPTPTPGAFYAIGDRDTIADIAKRAYGGTRRVPDLRAANPELDPRRLRPGTFLYVPIGAEPRPPAPKPLRSGVARSSR